MGKGYLNSAILLPRPGIRSTEMGIKMVLSPPHIIWPCGHEQEHRKAEDAKAFAERTSRLMFGRRSVRTGGFSVYPYSLNACRHLILHRLGFWHVLLLSRLRQRSKPRSAFLQLWPLTNFKPQASTKTPTPTRSELKDLRLGAYSALEHSFAIYSLCYYLPLVLDSQSIYLPRRLTCAFV